MTIKADVIAHSRPWWAKDDKNDIFTMELQYPRFIHSEFMTHRMFSRNASSSRAIPAGRMMQMVTEDPAMPVQWGKNQKGMQAYQTFDEDEARVLEQVWLNGLKDATTHTGVLLAQGLHKQLANRIMEPWAHITVVVTATEWDNFFNLRDHHAAQPEIQDLARKMKLVQAHSVPNILEDGQWHLPYALTGGTKKDAIRTSVAGCARVSYKNHDGSNRTTRADVELHDTLLGMGHMSPFEHQATPGPEYARQKAWTSRKGITHIDRKRENWSGNFRNWIQYRQILAQT